MTNSIGNFLGIAIFGLLLISYFSNDWIEYRCYGDIIKIDLYKKGGLVEQSPLGTLKWDLEVSEGTKYRTYMSENGNAYLKFNMEDLSYAWLYRAGFPEGQCKKVGFFKSIGNGAFVDAEGIE
jgi:hypothetical protein